MSEDKVILGIDPGTNILGFGVIRINAKGKPEYVDMGVLDIRRQADPYEKLCQINETVGKLCEEYGPQALAIESPFYARNAQVVFKLGRAQGAAIIAARSRGLEVFEYAPRKAKVAICGNGAASKEQVSVMMHKTLGIEVKEEFLDATDALAIALCHYYQITSPLSGMKASSSWEKFIAANPDRVK